MFEPTLEGQGSDKHFDSSPLGWRSLVAKRSQTDETENGRHPKLRTRVAPANKPRQAYAATTKLHTLQRPLSGEVSSA
jgi:hypothetical protein